MGEVYRATDTNLKRAVAIKVLPDSVAGDPERLARFQREAEVLASLNHPNIAHIHGLEKNAGVTALVMELVEGPTLADTIAQLSTGKSQVSGLPIADVLAIARQVADALGAAHEQGIIHRDLKPANIKVREDGTVKVLDFGLAKMLDPPRAEGSGQSVGAHFTQSPTLTTPAATLVGVILGTAAYMSPEQARGKPVDKRADIWAFGVVVYEMVTGDRLFKGEDIGEILAAVIKDEPPLDRVPASVRPLLQRCLVKDPRKRLRDIGDIGLLLDAQPQAVPAQPPQPRRASWLWPAVAALLLATTTGLAVLYVRQASPVQQTLRYQIPPPGNAPARMFAVSPDGKYLAFVASEDGPPRVWVRAMDALDSRAFAGTDGATFPFWSPDGQHLGFFAQGKLKVIAMVGGPPRTLCDATSGRGGTWNRDDVILFSAAPSSPILRVPAAGGVPAPVTKLTGTTANEGHRYPAFLPDGRHFLYNVGSDKPDVSGVFVGSLDGAPPVRLLPDQTNGLFAPPANPGGSGFLLFRRDGTLMAQPFDAARLKATGEMFPIAEQVSLGNPTVNTFGAFSAATNGTLVYQTAGPAANRELDWVDRSGKHLSTATKPAEIENLYSLSLGEKTLVMRITSGAGSDLWMQDLERGVLNRFTFRPGVNRNPVWSPDGSQVVFGLADPGGYSFNIFQKLSSGGGKEELLLHAGVAMWPTDWSPDGKFVVYQQLEAKTATDLWLLPLSGDRKPVRYLQTPFSEQDAHVLPGTGGDSRWMAYQSNESGRDQIYVQAIPATGAKYQLSTAGGKFPRWRSDGKELYYLSDDQKLMAVPVAVGASLQIGAPRELFTDAAVTFFVPSRDGQRFLVNLPAGGATAAAAPITVVTNWQAGLKR